MPSILDQWRRPYTAGPLTADEAEQYWSHGYVVKQGCLQMQDLQPSLEVIARRVDDLAAKLQAAGLISDPCSSLGVFQRLAALEQQFPDAGVLVHKDGRLPPEFAALWSHPTLLAIAQQLLGPHVGGHPSWNVRAKTPRAEGGDVPWHQDSAYCSPDARQTLQVTAWIPLLDVDAANGCMQLLRGGHLAGRTVAHTAASGNTWHVAMDEAAAAAELGLDLAADLVTVPMKAGDVLLFNNLIPHRSLDNTSDRIRWSLDLRWQHPDLPDGAYGLKRSIRMTDPADPSYVIPWAGWADVDKKTGQQQQQQQQGSDDDLDSTETGVAAAAAAADVEDPLSSVLVGPWLDLWPITHHNKHTRAWLAMKGSAAITNQ
uniref:Fe2OG dioxygenase domain-containing protein n=1 Tax=Tetradesmus obliquus TaxID=3088 RepID=A0A383WF13_TETOB|eukprot:jgi/Sobl393_1/7053/SZX75669.1